MFFVLDDFFVFIHFQIYQAMLPKLLVSFCHMLLHTPLKVRKVNPQVAQREKK